MYIPNAGEITIFVAAFLGALIGFLWYNTFPAQVFMGDTGSLTIGAIISVIALMIRKDFSFLYCVEFLWSKIFRLSSGKLFQIHQKKNRRGPTHLFDVTNTPSLSEKGYHESKIVARFWIIGILLSILTIVTLKLR